MVIKNITYIKRVRLLHNTLLFTLNEPARYEPEKICLILENRAKHPLKVKESSRKSHHRIQRIREPYSKKNDARLILTEMKSSSALF